MLIAYDPRAPFWYPTMTVSLAPALAAPPAAPALPPSPSDPPQADRVTISVVAVALASKPFLALIMDPTECFIAFRPSRWQAQRLVPRVSGTQVIVYRQPRSSVCV